MDDVQHLVSSGAAREDSYLMVIDSRQRDTSADATPSQYSVNFASPFRNVFGLDLLDATVARTEYIVDDTTNTLQFAFEQPVSMDNWQQGAWAEAEDQWGLPRIQSIRLDPGDYNLPQLIEHFNTKALQAAEDRSKQIFLKFQGVAEPYVVYIPPLQMLPLSNPSEITNKVVLVCTQPFTLLMDGSTLRHTLGFGDPVTTDATEYATVPGYTAGRPGGASSTFLSVPRTGDQLGQDWQSTTALTGPVPAAQGVQAISLKPAGGVPAAQLARQYFTSLTTGVLSQVLTYVEFQSSAPGPATSNVRVTVMQSNAQPPDVTVGVGYFTVSASTNDSYGVFKPVPLDAPPTLQNGGLVQTGSTYYVEYEQVQGDVGVGLYYNQDNLPNNSANRYIQVAAAGASPTFQTSFAGQNLCCDVTTDSAGHAVITPGIVNLSGPRYLNIRCPEIESHMFRDRVNEACHAGLGMIKLRGYGFMEQRFDFVSFPARRFHPIGKISKLTFRLERPDGQLYDSKGVDNTLLLVIRYYSLPSTQREDRREDHSAGDFSATTKTNKSMLNPSYTPDLRHHLVNERWREEARALEQARYGAMG
jgi:hypothetical protein